MKTKQKTNWKETLKAFAKRIHTEDIFWETEKNSNVFVAYGMLSVAAFLFIGAIMLQFWDLGYVDEQTNWICLAVELLMFLPLPIYCIRVKGDKRWLKFVLLLNVIIGIMFLTITCSYAVLLLLAIPVIVSARYFSVNLTRATAILTAVFYSVTLLLSVYWEALTEYDMNYCTMPAGMTITIAEDTWLYSSVLEAGIDKEMLIETLATYALPVRLLEFGVISLICIAVARRGHNMVVQQAEESAERAGLEAELALAAEIQLSALPTNLPAFPGHTELDLYAEMHPAKEIGGDFYDFFEIDGDHTAIVMADVSGKGVPAAMFMMTGKTMIRDYLRSIASPSAALSAVNAQLCENNEAELFITAWIGVLEVSTGILTYVNAGHCRPLLRRRGETELQSLEPLHNLPLACFDSTNYGQSEIRLCAGDEIFLYTDGVTEASDRSGELYGMGRLKKCLNDHDEMPLQELLREIKRDIDQFAGEEPQFDDITMLMLRLKAKE